jgi:hypothetical protein
VPEMRGADRGARRERPQTALVRALWADERVEVKSTFPLTRSSYP